jgi:hypothetical protein
LIAFITLFVSIKVLANDATTTKATVVPKVLVNYQTSKGAAPGYLADNICGTCHAEHYKRYAAAEKLLRYLLRQTLN